MMHVNYDYALVTPAKNEALTINQTILSVTEQTIKPQKWVIVSDGSTDETDNIVRNYENKIDYMLFLLLL